MVDCWGTHSYTTQMNRPFLILLAATMFAGGCASSTPKYSKKVLNAAETKKHEPVDITVGVAPDCGEVDIQPTLREDLTSALERYNLFKLVGKATSRRDKDYDVVIHCSNTSGMTMVFGQSPHFGAIYFNHSADHRIGIIKTIVWLPVDVRQVAYKAVKKLAKGKSGYMDIMEGRKAALAKEKEAAALASGVKTAATRRVRSNVDKPRYSRKKNPEAYALVVGVENYASLPNADFAKRDAEAVREHLIALGFPSRNVTLLTGHAASRSGLAKNIETWLPNNVSEKSTVFFYYSGHGAPDASSKTAYLVPSDGDPQYLKDTAYPLEKLYENLNSLKAKNVIVVLDTCFSGAGGRSVLAKGTRPLVTKVDVAPSGRSKIVSFTASQGDEISGTIEDEGHGLFTYYFLRGLNGAAKDDDGRVTVGSLYEYLTPNVQDSAKRDNRNQTPQFYSPPGTKGLRLR